jgi:hypothetical protein
MNKCKIKIGTTTKVINYMILCGDLISSGKSKKPCLRKLTLEPFLVAHTYITALQRLKQEDPEIEAAWVPEKP